jgi:hypothetical protein
LDGFPFISLAVKRGPARQAQATHLLLLTAGKIVSLQSSAAACKLAARDKQRGVHFIGEQTSNAALGETHRQAGLLNRNF